MALDKKCEAQCPACRTWSPVTWCDEIPPGGMWWANDQDGGCPVCGALILVESECAFREIVRDDPHNKGVNSSGYR